MRSPSARAVSLVAAVALRAGDVLAQDGTDVARRTLIEMATQASQRGEHEQAIELANRAGQLRNTASLRFFVAREHLRLAHHVQALAVAGDCVALANADRTAPDRDAMIARCNAVIDEAGRAVGRLVVRVEEHPPADLRVTVDGAELVGALYNIAVPHEPGAVEVRATAGGRERFVRAVELSAGETHEVSVALVAQRPAVAPARAVVETPRPRASVEPRDRPTATSAGPWALAGVALTGFATGAVAGAIAAAARADREAACPSATDCDVVTATRFDDRYRTSGTITNVALVTGGAFAVGALSWWLVQRFSRRSGSQRVSVAATSIAVRW